MAMSSGVLNPADLERVRTEFGVGDAQVRRDHAISHVLGALGAMDGAEGLTFFGGTALARTLLPALRLSEDLDLLTSTPRSEMASRIERAVQEGLRRSHGVVSWQPSLTQTRDSESAVLVLDGGIRIRIQLLAAAGYPKWPTTVTSLEQRYRDAPPSRLTTLTPAAFAAGKAIAWNDRRTARDLYDLWGLATENHIDSAAAELLRRHGPTSRPEPNRIFDIAPESHAWHAELDHQAIVRVEPAEALTFVRTSWISALADA